MASQPQGRGRRGRGGAEAEEAQGTGRPTGKAGTELDLVLRGTHCFSHKCDQEDSLRPSKPQLIQWPRENATQSRTHTVQTSLHSRW